MIIFLLIGIIIYLFAILLSFFKSKNKKKRDVITLIKQLIFLIFFLVAIFIFQIDIVVATVMFVIVLIVFDKKTYTKKRLIIYGSIIVVLVIVGYLILKEDKNYIFNYVKDHPNSTSLFVAYNGEAIISYQSEAVRSLASTVKIVIALEYANQVAEGKLEKEALIPIDELNKFYYKNTDGGAHEQWLKEMKEKEQMMNNEVHLHEVAKGMIMYSSNANTDYLIELLGMDTINQTIEELPLQQHDLVYPMVGASLIPTYIKEKEMTEDQLLEKLKGLSDREYRELAMEIHRELAKGNKMDLTELSMDVQKIWSDRLIGSTAEDYGVLLAEISNDKFPKEVNDILRELMEWPMDYNEGNKEYYRHLGMKGGATAFVLNQAAYVETLAGDKIEFVLLTDELTSWEAFQIGKNLNTFLVNIVRDTEFRDEVQFLLQ